MSAAFRAIKLDDGRRMVKIERVWDAVKRWAAANGHVYEPSYGVVGVAAT